MRRATLAILVASTALACSPPASDDAVQSSSAERTRRPLGMLVTGGADHTCVVARRGVRCWGRSSAGQTTPPPLVNATTVSAGALHACAIDDGGVKCWGSNGYGQTAVPALRGARQVVSGSNHVCALDDDGVKCWGQASFNQLKVPALRNPREVVAGGNHSCALDDDGVKCWGLDSSKQSTVPPLKNPSAVSAGLTHTCAIDDDGVKCWGSNAAGQLGVPSVMPHATKLSAGGGHSCALGDTGVTCWGNNGYGQITVPPLRKPREIAVGRSHSCAIDDEGVKCWGLDFYEQTLVPRDLELIGRHACVIGSDGAPRCVGDNERGQLGVGVDEDRVVALSTTPPTSLGVAFGAPAEIAVGPAFGCARSAAGAVKCWGYNLHGQLGLGDSRDRGLGPDDMGDALPALRFATGAPIAKVAVGHGHACALAEGGEAFCWGAGGTGQLGSESTDNIGLEAGSGPKKPLLGGVATKDLALGYGHTCLLGTDGAVRCFGRNEGGQLGAGHDRTVGDRPGTMGEALARVDLGDFAVKSIASGDRHSCALSTDGRVKCWGANEHGELGVGDTRDRGTSPDDLGEALPAVKLGNGQVVIDLKCGARHCCALMLQNTLKCWGDNGDGQLGLGDTLPRGADPRTMGENLTFVLLPPRERVLGFDLASDRTCARTESGLRCWGRNRAGELGYGDSEPRGSTQSSVPRLLPVLGI